MSGTVDIQQIYSLTPMQEGMLFHRLHDEDQAYFLQMNLTLRGELDLHLFRQSVNSLIERHDILRTVFLYEETKKTLQVVLSERQAEVTSECLADWTPERINARIEEFKAEDRIRGFDLSEDVPMRTSIFQTGRDTFEVIWSFHHIVVDGWSMGILMKDFFEMYGALYTGTAPILNSVRPYSDFIRWYEQQDKQEAAEYWRHYLAGYEEQATLPKLPMSAERNNEYLQREEIRKLDAETVRRLVQIGNGCGATVNTVIQVAWGVLLGKYNHTRDVVFGSVISGREAQVTGIESMVGLFINTIPVRIRLEGEVSFAETVQRAQEEALESTQFGYFPLVDIQSFSSLRQGLVDQIMAFENFVQTPSLDDRNVGFQIEGVSGFEQTHYDFNIIVLPEDDGMSVKFTYNAAVYDEELIRRAMGHYCRILETVSMHPDILNEEIVMVSEEEKWQLTIENNLTEQEYARDKTLHGLFEEQVRQTPNAVALLFEDRQWTYRELDEKANRLAMQLRTLGMGAGKPVGILAERGPDMVAGVLGVLKAGGAYVPFEPGWPQSRIAGIMESLSMEHMLTTHRQLPVVRGLLREVPSLMHAVCMEETVVESHGEKQIYGLQKAGAESLEYEAVAVDAEQLAYIIFTSGSTGTPKGVAVCHRPVINLIEWVNRTFEIGAEDRILFVTSMCFDLSVYDVFGLLAAGGSVHIAGEEEIREPEKLAERLWKEPITFWDSAPAAMQQVAAYFPYMQEELRESRLRTVFLSGDWIPLKLSGTLKRYFEKVETVALGGATEATVWSNYYRIEEVKAEWASIPYGKPIQNARYYILDERLNPCPEGVGGEIYIGGECLASGYVGDPEMTERKFVADPYSSLHGGRMYRTGDRARWMADGNIEFLGRLDYQVKIRGYRIEPGEIQSALMKHPAVREAMVLDHEDGTGQKYLCAYTVLENGEETPGLEEYLAQRLPSYMIPAHFMVLESMPVTVNGKLDRKALPKPQWGRGQEYVAPRNELERQLVEIWQEVLEVERVGVTDNFFNLGGHSIKAMLIAARIRLHMSVKLPVGLVFQTPTISGLVNVIRRLTASPEDPILSLPKMLSYPVTPSQKRLFILQTIDPSSVAYNVPGTFMFEGKVDPAHIRNIFYKLISRHESLRTTFEIIDGVPVQRIHDQVEFEMEVTQATDDRVRELVLQFVQPFELERGPLFRAKMIELSGEKRLLFVDMHHIITDGLSMSILLQEFQTLYHNNHLPENQLQYKDYTAWFNERVLSDEMKQMESYWLGVLSGQLPILELPTDRPRQVRQSNEGKTIKLKVDKEMKARLTRLAFNTDSTAFMVLFAAYNIMLYKYTRQKDLIVGVPAAGRTHKQTESMIGVFINTLALRNRIDPEQSFESFLRQVRENSLDAYENQEYPFDLLVEKLELSRDISRNPVFDTMFSMQHEENVFQENNGMFIRPYEIEYPVSKFDLSLDVEDNEDGYVFAFEYNTDLWDEDTAIRFASHYVNLLSVLGDKGDIAIKDIGILSSQEHSQIVNDFNSNRLFFSGEDTFPKVFEHVACSCEDLIAVVDSTKSYTYREINAKANQLARKLRGTGLEPGMAVGILADRSADMIIAVIAVMKAGGAYLPVDPEYPAERIEFLLRDSQSGILVAQPQYEILAQQAFNGEMISLEESVYSGEDTNLPDIHQPSDLAYVIYTSGSTGLPKGVMIEHRSLINAAFVWRKEYNLQDFRIRLLQLSSFSFDVFAGDLCRALLNGGQLVLCENEARADLEALYDLMSAYRINVMESTPALIVPLMEYIHSNGKSIDFLKLLILGSDVLPVHDYSKLKARFGDKVRIINSYGVTEACIDASYYEGPAIMSLAHMPVGKPLPNAEFYVLDEDKQIQPIGVIGELYIGGEGVARGYYRNPVLTEERFIDNPFKPASRMYRTGDMAKWMPGGNLLLIGREDRQVNLHGHRIELGEVEAGLLGHPKVKEAAALIRTGTGESHLCAFIVSDNEVETDDVYRFLQQTLPFYMLPSRIVPINQLPLTPNMKIDYRKLELTIEASIDIFVAPRNELEEKLAEIWRNVLHLDRISTNDSLFAIGGNSLKAMTIVGEAAKRFDIHLNLRDMFQFPTIRQLAELVKENDVVSGSYQRILPAEELLRYPLTPAQRRLFLLEQMQDVGTSYNTPIVLKVSGELQIERLETAIHTLVQRHESLRTSFEWLDGELFQRIHEVVDFSMKISSFSETTVDLFASELIRPFELGKAPLIRFGVGQWNDLEHLLILDMHHIIADGISAEILLKEIVSLYEGTELPDVTLHYKDYAVWLKKQEESGHLTEQEQYWLKTFGGKLPVLQLTTDFPRPPVQCFDGDYLLAYTDAVLLSNVKQIAIEHETTMFVVLLSIFNLLLHKYTDQNDLIVGTPVAGRNHPDIGDTVGMFVNTLALRNFPSEEMTFSDFLGAVKETTLSAFAHQDYPLEDLIEKLDLSKDLSRNALFDVLFVLQDSDSERLMIGQELRFEPHLVERKVSKFDLTITVEEKSGGLEIHLEYSTALFTEATAKRITNHYIHLIRQVTESPLSQLKDFQLITPEEKKQVVFDFNRTESVPHKSSHICHLLKEAVELHAARPAIITDTHVISYDEFNRLSNSLARRIVELGIKANETVAVMGKRSIPMLIGIMAVLKSGGAYLPLDPDYPEERTRYILKDSKTNLLLTFSEDTPDYFDGHILYLDDESIYQNDGSDLGIAISSTDLAYVIYTSGSTGQPKGVMVEHGSLMNRLNWMQRRYPLSSLDVVLQKTTAAFDVSVWELFWWIFSGAQVCLLSPGEEKDPSAIVEAIDHHQITTLHFVPSMLQVFLDFINLTERSSSLSTLRTVFASGEALKRNQVVLFNDLIHSRNGAQLVNLYGPTEATIDVTSYNCSPLAHADIVPIGCPIDNTSLYVLNRHLHHQPIGVIGELAIAGMGLARGYLHNPSLTSQKFVNLPEMKERVYLTGDLVKWLPDGNLAYIGRSDHQVKIRGYRIELGEIETHLCQCHGVKNAAAVVRQDANGEDDLWAFVVCEAMKVSDLNEYLIERIPQYMVPSRFHFIDKMPLLSNGKADRNVLAQMEIKELHRDDYLGPRNRKEELLTEIWKEVLGSERVGVRDNFFTVGGQSLRAANVVSLLYKKHRIALSLRDLFLYPTIEQLSERLISIDISKDVDRIPKAEERELYPISSAQKRLLILNELNEESLNYNMPSFLKVTGNIDVRRVEEAFVKVIARHETLRTSIVWVDAEPYQKVHQEVPFSLKELTCLEEDLQNVAESLVRPFNLQVSPFFRASMVRITDGDYRVLFTDMHHIVSDGMSQNVFWNDFIFFYQEGGHLEEVPLQYKDFAVWQQDRRMSTSYLAQENYWLKNLGDDLPIWQGPRDFTRPPFQSFEGAQYSFSLDSDLSKKLRQLLQENNCTLFMGLLAFFQILLVKYSMQEDVVVGSPVPGRPHEELRGTMGMFVNMIAIRNNPSSNKTFSSFLQEVRISVLDGLANQEYLFEDLVEALNLKRDMSRNPIFDAVIIVNDGESVELDGISMEPYLLNSDQMGTKFDLTLETRDLGDLIGLNFVYSKRLFKADTIERMANHFIQLIRYLVHSPDEKISNVSLISEEQTKILVQGFNQTVTELPPHGRTLQDCFESQVEKTPDRVALVFGNHQWTYRELNERANRIAIRLRRKGVYPNSIVGIMMDRSLEAVLGILAILKSGGAYLPLDPQAPTERISFMLHDSQALMVVTSANLKSRLDFSGDIILIDDPLEEEDCSNLIHVTGETDLAYVIYTSGTTGTPKGVMIEHRNVVHYIFTFFQVIHGLTERQLQAAQLAPIYFDMSVKPIFGSLLLGHTMHIVPEEIRKHPDELISFFNQFQIDIGDFTPTLFRMLNSSFLHDRIHVKYYLIGGEPLPAKVVEQFIAKFKGSNPDYFHIFNIYGATEACVNSTYKPINYPLNDSADPSSILTLGTPLPNQEVYILDDGMNVLPVGLIGEIFIGGKGVARGYLNRPDLNAYKFIPNPFRPGENMYRTGDLGRWRSDGQIESFGRIDHQVKIQGNRIEIGEIEVCLHNHQSISEAVVIPKHDSSGDQYLCAYIVTVVDLTVNELRNFLADKLPEYMIPAYFVNLESLPLTTNGKIDRGALPEPDGSVLTGTEYKPPGNHIESELLDIWNGLIGLDWIGVNDNFFHVGGNSLKATMLISKIHKRFNVQLSLKDVFERPTIEELAKQISVSEESSYHAIIPVAEATHYPVSSAQKRLYLLDKISQPTTTYNSPRVVIIAGSLDIKRLNRVLFELVNRHEILRTSFAMVEGELVQIVHQVVDFQLEYSEKTINSEFLPNDSIHLDVHSLIRPFDLSSAPLIRAGIVKLSEDSHVFVVDMHHIVSDGISKQVFFSELQRLYEQKILPPLPVQYKDYAVWQSKFVESARYKQQEEYWLSVFEGDVPVLDLPGDYPRPAVKSFEGASFSQPINLELSRALRRLASDTGTTVYMVLLGLLNVLLLKYSGQEDIVVGSPVAGRNHTDLEWVMGMFVNTLAIRNRPTGDKTFEAFLEEVKINAIHAFEHQDYPFEELVDKLNISRDMSRNPLFEVMLVYQNIVEPALQEGFGDEIRISAYDAELSGTAKFDLNVIVEDLGEGLLFQFEYCTRLFKRETVEQMAQHLMEIAWTVTADPHTQISAIPMLTQEERQLILYDFNDTDKAYSSEQTLHGLVEEQARRNPDAPALVLGNESMTYGELENKANRLARHLVEQGVAMGAHVGLMTQRGFAMVIGMLAILKAGAAYVPIDPAYPAERKRYIMDHAEIAALVTDRASEFEHDRTVRIDAELLAAYSAEPLDLPELARERAYVIYTSGSTGMPKGVMIGHRSVVNLIEWVNRRFLVNEADTLLFITSMCFDLSVYDIFGLLAAGGRVVLAQTEEVQDPERLKGLMEEHRITFWDSVPTTMNYLIQHMERQDEKWQQSDLRLVFMSGDWIPVNLPSRIKNHFPGTEVLSLGGATEGTIWSNYYPIEEVLEEQSSIPYGKPIANSYFYILDKYLSPVPYGVPGELYIGGVGVAQGYLKDPEKTGTSFLKNPFLPEEGERMYKTGDVGLMLPDGNMQFIGRKDHQVKIRGYRVELGEVESALLRLEGVKEAIVMDREEREGGKYLCAYIVASEELKAKDLRSGLGRLIPDYMVPLAYVFLSQLPMTSNGKIDRKALPAPEGQERGETYTPPENEWEEKLASYWEELLDVRPIGVKSDFFELGGHSLKAAALIGKVYAEMQVELPLPYVFRYPTIRQLAERLREVTDWESEKPVLQFGDPSGEPIFAFPPAGGYGSVYKGLAEELEGFTVYGFDFIEDEARIVRYKQMIREIQPQGPYRLVGYSAGGNLAYEVAKAMEEDGEEIRELVMIDATRRTERINQTMEQMRAEVEKELPELEKMHAFMNVEPIRRKVIERSLLYNQYLNGIVNGGRIKANIHCIISEGRNRETGWRDVATSYREYSGFGQHLEMLDPSLVRRNTDVLQSILKESCHV